MLGMRLFYCACFFFSVLRHILMAFFVNLSPPMSLLFLFFVSCGVFFLFFFSIFFFSLAIFGCSFVCCFLLRCFAAATVVLPLFFPLFLLRKLFRYCPHPPANVDDGQCQYEKGPFDTFTVLNSKVSVTCLDMRELNCVASQPRFSPTRNSGGSKRSSNSRRVKSLEVRVVSHGSGLDGLISPQTWLIAWCVQLASFLFPFYFHFCAA